MNTEPLVEGVGDNWDMLVLDKATPPSLHLFLAVNDLVNFLESSWPEIKEVLFGVEPHSYQGRDRNYNGPEIRLILGGDSKVDPSDEAQPHQGAVPSGLPPGHLWDGDRPCVEGDSLGVEDNPCEPEHIC